MSKLKELSTFLLDVDGDLFTLENVPGDGNCFSDLYVYMKGFLVIVIHLFVMNS